MDGIIQHWEIWTLLIAVQAGVLVFGHFLIRDKYLNYWLAGLIGVSVWLVPLIVASVGLGYDPRPLFLFVAAAIAMFGGVGLEAVVRRGAILSIVFHTLVVLGIGMFPGGVILWLAFVPPRGGWVTQLIASGISIVVCGVVTIMLHYNDMVGGMDIYRNNGLTPGERRTIADATYILERKLQPRLGDVTARIKRATEQMQSGLAGIDAAHNLLSLVVLMLQAIREGADEAYIMSLVEDIESNNSVRERVKVNQP